MPGWRGRRSKCAGASGSTGSSSAEGGDLDLIDRRALTVSSSWSPRSIAIFAGLRSRASIVRRTSRLGGSGFARSSCSSSHRRCRALGPARRRCSRPRAGRASRRSGGERPRAQRSLRGEGMGSFPSFLDLPLIPIPLFSWGGLGASRRRGGGGSRRDGSRHRYRTRAGLALGLALCPLLAAVTLTDLERRVIPNALVLPGESPGSRSSPRPSPIRCRRTPSPR